MSSYTPVATALPATINRAADGENPTGAILGGQVETVANAVKYLQDRIHASVFPVTPQAQTRVQADPGRGQRNAAVASNSSDSLIESTATPTAASDRAVVIYALDPPNGCAISAVDVKIIGSASATAAPGAGFRPEIEVYAINQSSGAVTTLGTAAAGAYGSLGAFQAAHQVSVTFGSPHTVDRTTYRYVARIFGEYGANQAAGTKFICCRVTQTTTSSDLQAG